MAVRHHAVIGTPVADGRDQQRQQCPDLARTLAAFRELLDGGFAPPSWTPAPAARCVRSPYRSASARRIPSAPPVSRNGCPSRLVRRRVNGSRQASCSCSTTTAACRPHEISRPETARFVGMHVVDLKSGHVLSACSAAPTTKAAARSANGRFLAMGTTYTTGGWKHRVTLWDVAQGRTPAQLDTSSIPRDSEIQAAFSWSGSALWALGTRELMLWQLPAALRDHATRGAAPDQSRN